MSCNKADDVGDAVDKIKITFQQRSVNGKQEPYLLCTGGSYDCSGVPISFQFDKTEHVLYLNFGPTYGGKCNGSYNRYPAYTYVYLGALKHGKYMFEISNLGQTAHGILEVSENKYVVTGVSGSTVYFEDDPAICHITPSDALWGYVFSVPESKEHYLIDSLYALGSIPYAPLLENGNYYYYTVSDGSAQINLDNGLNSTKFLLKSSLDTALLRSVVTYFGSRDTLRSAFLRTGAGQIIRW